MPDNPIAVTADQVRWYRLRRSGLITPFATPEAAAHALFGIQAQILPAAGVALWNRTAGLTHARFEELLFTERTLVKLWGQRGTLHLYPSIDWPLVCGMIGNARSWWGQSAAKEDRYDEYNVLVEQVAQALRERGTMSRVELRAAGFDLDDDHLSPWGGLFADLVQRGHACHSGRIENQGQFAHREHWLPDLAWDPPDPEDANRTVLRRYVHAYGPTTIQDFIYWRGAKSESPRRRWDELAGELVEVDMAGQRQFLLRADIDDLLAAPDGEWPLHLLYRFDPLLLAHKSKEWIVPSANYRQVWRPAGHIEGIVLAQGKAVATWRYNRKGTGLVITVEPFRRLARPLQKKIGKAADRVAQFFGVPLIELKM